MAEILIPALETLNQILTAGIAITAFSLLVYALTFNLRHRVARSFAIILFCVVIVFSGDALSSAATAAFDVEFWLRFQWVGIIILPAAYLHFSDALLETTGRPSRGRRRLLVRLMYLSAIAFLVTLPTSRLVGRLVIDGEPAPFLERTGLTLLFIGIYIVVVGLAGVNFWRAYNRTVLPTSRRRMQYLLAGAVAPALGSFPFLLFGSDFAAARPLFFWFATLVSNILVTFLLVIMSYSVAFFGVPWPDRVVKRRLFKWLMRGPVTACTVLALTTVVRRAGLSLGVNVSTVVPVLMVITVLVMEHWITVAAPVWERVLFYGGDRADLNLIQQLEERMLTSMDLREFLEAVLAAVCDQVQVSTAFVAGLNERGMEYVFTVGDQSKLQTEDLAQNILQEVRRNDSQDGVFSWRDFWLIPLENQEDERLVGLLGVLRKDDEPLDEVQIDALLTLGDRAALALKDRILQQRVFTSLKEITPQVELIQRLRAAARYDQGGLLTAEDALPGSIDIFEWVR